MIVSAHAHKPDFEPLLKIYFELYFLLFFFPLPFVLVLLSTLYGDRKALAVFFNRKKRLFFNVAKFPLVSIFICFNLFQWCAISCLILQIRSVTCNKLQLSVFCVCYQRSSLVICLCFLFLNTFAFLRLDVLNIEEEFRKYLVHAVIYRQKNLDFAEVANRSFSHCYRPSHEVRVNRKITH